VKRVADRLTGRQKSAATAKERLQLVLIHDRADLPPGVMEDLRDEIIEVISRHIEVDVQAVNIQIAQDGRKQRLLADIPIKPKDSSRRRR
jgi:cell division topological specificity factor